MTSTLASAILRGGTSTAGGVAMQRDRTFTPRTFGDAIDSWKGELARRGMAPTARAKYVREMNHAADTWESLGKRYVHELTREDYEADLDRYVDRAPSTIGSQVSIRRNFSEFCWDRGWHPEHVAYKIRRPKRHRPEDTKVKWISTQNLTRLLAACETPRPHEPRSFQELLCIATAIYVGRRRAALARARRSDADLDAGFIRFTEKGGKAIEVPLPDEYLALLREADQHGVWKCGADYLIPNRRPGAVKNAERSDKVIYETVKKVLARIGVDAHVHAIRAAFAVLYEDQNPGRLLELQDLMGHSEVETTKVYLRRRDRQKGMESVRSLTLIAPSSFPAGGEEAHTGFEPVPPPRARQERLAAAAQVPSRFDPLRAKLEAVRNREQEGARTT